MRLHSWLTNLDRRLTGPKIRSGIRRHRQSMPAVSAIIEQLEPRQLLSVAAIGLETRANTHAQGNQQDSSVAIDTAGDSVAVWTSNGQDGSGYGVYAQRFNAAGDAQGGEFKVNTFTTGAQGSASVAMDAAGDFVITWSSYGQDGSASGIYAQRYNATGAVQGSEFKVNTFTSNDQASPTVAMDSAGNFVITWFSYGQGGEFDDIYAQRFNATGVAQGSEFLVNTFTTNFQRYPKVAMDSSGDFVIVWQSYFQDDSREGVYAQRFNSSGVAQGTEFQVNTTTDNDQLDPSVGMDAAGDFVITWGDNNIPEISAQRYKPAGIPQGSEFKVNSSFGGGGARVAVQATGDFVVVWQGIDDANTSSDGILARRFNAAGVVQGSEFTVNTYTTGLQLSAAVAINSAGDFITSWDSFDQDGSGRGIYTQRYIANVGPIVSAVLQGAGPRVVQDGDRLTQSITTLSLNFSDDLNTVPGGANSVTNPANWRLTRNGADDSHLISGITFGFNSTTNRYVAVVSFSIALPEGLYQLVARQTIQDLTGRPLDGEVDRLPGGNFHRNFSVAKNLTPASEMLVNSYTTGNQFHPSVAMDATGDSVATWVSVGQNGGAYDIYAQRFSAAGVAQGSEFKVSIFTLGNHFTPMAAMDAAGNFVIAWKTLSQDGDQGGIYARRYNAAGTALNGEFLVNTYTTGDEESPSISMDAVGDFVIAWDSFGQDGSNTGIFAQRYNSAGATQGVEFQVNSYTTNNQTSPSVAMDAAGDFVVAWNSYGQDGADYGIFAQRFNSAGVVQGSEFQVSSYTTGRQFSPAAAMDTAGDFVIAWNDGSQDGNDYGVYSQRYDSSGIAKGGEFRANTFTTGSQSSPAVAMGGGGDYVIAWESIGQDGSLGGVYVQRYSSTGFPDGNEFRTNTYTTSIQELPKVAMDAKGDFFVAWDSYGQDGSQYGVYALRSKTGVAPYLSQIEATPLNAVGPMSTPVTSSLSVYDRDIVNWTGATVEISNNYLSNQDVLGFTNTAKISGSWNVATGTLTLTGTDTLSNYRTALRSVT